MLIQAAIRSVEKTRLYWHEGQTDEGFESLLHAQEIVTELLNGINPEVKDEITQKVAGIYLFIFRCLIEANFEHEEKKLDDAVRVLREEQETWQKVCEQLGDSGKHSAVNVSLHDSLESAAPVAAPVLESDANDTPAGGFSFEA
jgi:flagellar biosynthetic protein FliS